MNNNRISGHQPRDNEFQAKGLLTKIAIDHGSFAALLGELRTSVDLQRDTYNFYFLNPTSSA
jgi:hypothetical protein